jgi:glycerol kinase
MAKYAAAIDQGTTSTRCMLFDHAGAVVSVHQLEHEQIYPQAGWVEHDPMEIWARTQDVVKEALSKVGATAADIAAVGVTNQRETTVVWDKNTGKPYYNAIVWQDTRTDKICNMLAEDGGQDRFRKKVGLPLATYFSGPKIRWMLDNVDGLKAAADRGDAIFGNIDTWVIWNVTGGVNGGAHVTDVTNASRTMLMNLETLDWDEEILGIMGVPRQMLPEIRPSSDPAIWGTTPASGPFGGEIPVCGDLGDQQAALVGQACLSVGEAKNTYGTGCFMLLNTGTDAVQSTNVQWLRDNLNLIDSSPEVEDLAKTVEDNGGIYFVPAFSGLFAPYWKSDARGVIVGMTRYVNKGHFARAALEATAYQTREVLDAMNADSGVDLTALKVDGGMVYNELLMQFQSDILGVPVVRPKVAETTSMGAAYAGGLATGFWETEDEIRQNWGMDKTWNPAMSKADSAALFGQWKKAVTRTFDWIE